MRTERVETETTDRERPMVEREHKALDRLTIRGYPRRAMWGVVPPKRWRWVLAVVVGTAGLAILLVVAGSGPIGPSLPSKVLPELIRQAAGRIGADIATTTVVPPAVVRLPWFWTVRVGMKQALWRFEFGGERPEYADEYVIRSNQGEEHCTVRVRAFGDHVLAVSVAQGPTDRGFARQLRASLAQQLPDYEVELSTDA